MDLFEEFIEVVRIMEAARIRYALVGGLALGVYVQPRATQDIDFLLHPADWPAVTQVLAPFDWLELAGPMDFAAIRIRRLTKIKDADVLVLDLLLADAELAGQLDEAYTLEHMGQKMRVAKPETIIQLKRGRMSEQDKVDIAALEELLKGTS